MSGPRRVLGNLEFLVLNALYEEEPLTAGGIVLHVERACGHLYPQGCMTTVLQRLHGKRMVKTWEEAEPRPMQGGRRRRFYEMRPDGVRALAETKQFYYAQASA